MQDGCFGVPATLVPTTWPLPLCHHFHGHPPTPPLYIAANNPCHGHPFLLCQPCLPWSPALSPRGCKPATPISYRYVPSLYPSRRLCPLILVATTETIVLRHYGARLRHSHHIASSPNHTMTTMSPRCSTVRWAGGPHVAEMSTTSPNCVVSASSRCCLVAASPDRTWVKRVLTI